MPGSESVSDGLAGESEHLVEGNPGPSRDVGVHADLVDDPAGHQGLQGPHQVREIDAVHGRAVADVLLQEGDLLPGLVVDRYGHALVLQVGTAGLELLRDTWWPILFEIGKREGLTAFVERSQSGRRDEGLDPVNRLLKGSLAGPVTVRCQRRTPATRRCSRPKPSPRGAST